MSTTPPTFLIIDGNALLYRAFHAFPLGLTTPAGDHINAVYGFTRILLSTIKDIKPVQAAVCFDLSGPTFRHEAYPEYKANRLAMPDELRSQIDRAHQLVEYLEMPVFTAQGYEADDCIATITDQAIAADPNIHVLILTGDQDIIQLVTDRVSVLRPGIPPKPALQYTPVIVQEQYGFTPLQMIDYKGLRGDPSDNIPGVPGIGEVTGKKLIAQFGSVEGVYAAIDAGTTDGISASVLTKLITNRELAFTSKSLATIDHTAPVQYDPTSALLQLGSPEKLVKLFEELGFKSLMRYLPGSHKTLTEAADVFGVDAEESVKPVAPESESERTDAALAPILRLMEQRGVKIDKPYLATLQEEFTIEVAALKTTLHETAGEEFNPDSPSQVGHILYEVLNIPTNGIRKGKTGYTTDAATLTQLAPTVPLAQLLLRYREVTKLQSTYVIPLQEIADEADRIHTSYAPDTATGRISSRNPNLQNIPSRSEEGRRIRQAFIASPGMVLVGADYSQMELRVAAHLSGDEKMKEAFHKGSDFHTATAEQMHVDRRVAKIINFSILYGKGAFGFAVDLGITVAEAKAYIEQYFATYPQLRHYLDDVVKNARINGYTETMFGRRRYLPEITSSNANHRAAAEREALNHPIQGSQADILKIAMCNLAKVIPESQHLILTVHDELVLEVPETEVAQAAALLKQTMIHAVELSVPIGVTVKTGINWSAMQALGE